MTFDGFKHVNDTFGHGIGGQVLIRVAERLAGCVRPGDLIARLGGDEFVILSMLPSEKAMVGFGDRIRAAINVPFDIAGQLVSVGISIGMTAIDPTISPDAVLDSADHAMYADKRTRRTSTTTPNH